MVGPPQTTGMDTISGLLPGLLGCDADCQGAAQNIAEVGHGLLTGITAKEGKEAKESVECGVSGICQITAECDEGPEREEQCGDLEREGRKIESAESGLEVDHTHEGENQSSEVEDKERVEQFAADLMTGLGQPLMAPGQLLAGFGQASRCGGGVEQGAVGLGQPVATVPENVCDGCAILQLPGIFSAVFMGRSGG